MPATAPPHRTLRARLGVAFAGAALVAAATVLAADLAWQSTRPAGFVAGAVLLLGTALLAILVRSALRPLDGVLVAASAEAIAVRATLEQQVAARTTELSEARDRAEREARLKGGFLAAMSHEIRTPMNSIVGMAELMAETSLDSEQREYCDTIRTSTDALLGVINDILDFSKIEAQGVSLEIVDFDLRLVIEDAVDLLAVKAASAGIDLAAVIEPGFDGRFRGDPSRLRQVVVNLLGNAVKFTPRGHVAVRVSTVATDTAGRRVRVEIVDTGIGLSAEARAGLFRPFAQAEDGTARQYGGTGLGLTISKQIVERMGGVLGVSSRPGLGSTFWFEVPLAGSAALDRPLPPIRGVVEALVLEPRERSAEALISLLADLGVRATRVGTAGDGLAALDARPAGFAVALVSTDAVDAAPFVDVLQQHAAAARTTIVAVVPANRRRAADLEWLGATPRLTRPVRWARLVECFDALASGPLTGAGTAAPRVTAQSAVPELSPPPTGGASAAIPPNAARVLVADDYFANQRLVTRLLEKRGYHVEAVSNGEAAVETVLERSFDIVLMDCHMPVLDGYAATERIRALEVGRRTPILAMTANDTREDRDACRQAGMDDYLVKPIQAAIVLAAVERWVALGQRAGAPGNATPGATDTSRGLP